MIRNRRGPGIQFKNRLFSITEYRLIVSVHPDSEERHVHLISVRILEQTSRIGSPLGSAKVAVLYNAATFWEK